MPVQSFSSIGNVIKRTQLTRDFLQWRSIAWVWIH
jgi:hypothetical protein